MGCTVDLAAFRAALDLAGRFTGTGTRASTLPVLSHVRLRSVAGHLVLTACDLAVAYTVSLPATGVLAAAGLDLCAPRAPLARLLRYHPAGDLTLRPGRYATHFVSEQDGLSLATAHLTATIPTLSAEEFPELPHLCAEEPIFSIVEGVLAALLDRTLYAAATDASRGVLTAVELRRTAGLLRLNATDGYRLASSTAPAITPCPADLVITLGAAHLALVRHCLHATGEGLIPVYRVGERLRLDVGAGWICVPLRDEGFVQVAGFLKGEEPHWCTVDRDVLLRAVRSLPHDPDGIRLRTEGQTLIVSDQPQTILWSMLAACGQDLKCGIQGKYLMEYLRHAGPGLIRLCAVPARERVAAGATPYSVQGIRLCRDGKEAEGESVIMPINICRADRDR